MDKSFLTVLGVKMKSVSANFLNLTVSDINRTTWKFRIIAEKVWMSEIENFPSSSNELLVSEAIRRKQGQVKVTGRLIGQSSVYNITSAINQNCTHCGYKSRLNYSNKPRFKSSIPEYNYCFKLFGESVSKLISRFLDELEEGSNRD